jgi:SagB-type dehydrogenase family enzyme
MKAHQDVDYIKFVKEYIWLKVLFLLALLLLMLLFISPYMIPEINTLESPRTDILRRIKLPPPVLNSNTSVEEAISKRRSVRNYKDDSLSLQETAQLLWAAQGITSSDGGRTAPSAGALYPLEVYLVSGEIQGLSAGIFHYLPKEHSLEQIATGDMLNKLYFAAMMQGSIKRGAGIIVFTAVYSRTTWKYGERGKRYVHMEAGHAAQNVCLQAVSLGIGTVTVGAFRDSAVCNILNLPEKEEPLYLMPIGKSKGE